MNQGIIRHANDATSQYKIAEEKEKIALGYQNYKMDKIANSNATLTVDTATVEGSEAEGGWTITFTETGNVYELDTNGNITKTEDPAQDEIAKIRAGYNKYQSDKANNTQQRETEIAELNQQIEAKQAEIDRLNQEAKNNVNQSDLSLLERYCLGEDKKGKDLLNDVLNIETSPWTFKNNEIIPNAGEELTYANIEEVEMNGEYIIYIYFNYNEGYYKLTAGFEYDSDNSTYSYPTKAVEPAVDTTQLSQEIQDLTNQRDNKSNNIVLPELTVEDATVYGNENNGWTITFTETENKYTLDGDGEIVPIPELRLEHNSISLGLDSQNNEGETKEIKVITKGGLKGVKWTIADDGVARLNKYSGNSVKVTAIKKGTTTVTASCGEYSDTCSVVVGTGFKYGNLMLKVGDYINYDHTKDSNGNTLTTEYISYSEGNASVDKNNGRNSGHTSDQTFNVSNYNGGWRVLGIKDGKLQLISAIPVGSLAMKGQQGYTYSIDELNKISAIYGHGKGATEARSINVEDINEVTGFIPEGWGGSGTSRYGTEVSYKWNKSEEPSYYYVDANDGPTTGGSNNSRGIRIFYAFVDNDWQEIPKAKSGHIAKLTSTFYYYYPTTLRTSDSGDIKGISTNSFEYEVLFQHSYWLASRAIYCNNSLVSYPVRIVSSNNRGMWVYGSYLFNSKGNTITGEYGVRPIVTLSPDVTLGEKVDGVWQIVEK